MRKKAPHCMMCEQRPAISLKGERVKKQDDGKVSISVYKYATAERIFCSYKCAAIWALCHVNDGEFSSTWCSMHAKWFNQSCDECIDERGCPDAEDGKHEFEPDGEYAQKHHLPLESAPVNCIHCGEEREHG